MSQEALITAFIRKEVAAQLAPVLATLDASITSRGSQTELDAVKAIAQAGATATALGAVSTLVSGRASSAQASSIISALAGKATSADIATLTQAINALSTGVWKFAEYLTNGTFVVPAGVTRVILFATAGGGSGAAGSGVICGGGASGEFCVFRIVPVTPGASIAVTIGLGGAAKAASGNGNQGGITSFGSILTLLGGDGGRRVSGGFANSVPLGGAQGAYSAFLPHGSLGSKPGGYGGSENAGGGAGGLFGPGTDSVSSGNSADAAANSGAGSGAAYSGGSSGTGGSGRMIVMYQ